MARLKNIKQMMAFDANTLYDAEKTKIKYDEMWNKCAELYNIFK